MNKTAICLAVAAMMVGLAGCEPAGPDNEQLEREVKNAALQQTNQEKELLDTIAKGMKEKDPSVRDVYLGHDDDGNKVLFVTKQQADGTVQEFKLPYSVFKQTLDEATAKAKQTTEATQQASGGMGAGGSFLAGMAGGMMGGMLAGMMANNSSAFSRGSSYSSPAAASAASATRATSYQRSNYQALRQSTYSRAASSAASGVGRSSGGSFSSSGARSGGYSSGG